MPDTSSGMLSRVYVSSAFESTAGTAATLNKSFWLKSFSLNLKEKWSKLDEVTGYVNATGITREELFAMGSWDDYVHPDLITWMSRLMYGAAPTSGLVAGGTSTVYEHEFGAVTFPVKTFTAMKQLAGISGFTEKFAGNGITDLSIKSGSGRISAVAKIEGMGVHTLGDSEPVVSPITTASEDAMVGVNSTLLIDDVELTTGDFDQDWSLDIGSGQAKLSTGGAAGLGHTSRYDQDKERALRFNFTRYLRSAADVSDFKAASFHTYEVKCLGPLIDVANSLRSMVSWKLTKARFVDEVKTEIGPKGVFKLTVPVEGIIDISTGKDLITKCRNLVASYA